MLYSRVADTLRSVFLFLITHRGQRMLKACVNKCATRPSLDHGGLADRRPLDLPLRRRRVLVPALVQVVAPAQVRHLWETEGRLKCRQSLVSQKIEKSVFFPIIFWNI